MLRRDRQWGQKSIFIMPRRQSSEAAEFPQRAAAEQTFIDPWIHSMIISERKKSKATPAWILPAAEIKQDTLPNRMFNYFNLLNCHLIKTNQIITSKNTRTHVETTTTSVLHLWNTVSFVAFKHFWYLLIFERWTWDRQIFAAKSVWLTSSCPWSHEIQILTARWQSCTEHKAQD